MTGNGEMREDHRYDYKLGASEAEESEYTYNES